MIDTRSLLDRMHVFECIALVPRVSSTNVVARRIAAECIENDIATPRAIIVAREQLAGRGRNGRTWTSPRDSGIWSTIMQQRSSGSVGLLPLEIGVAISEFLRETFAIDARLKWPNDIVVGDRKIGGILIEARSREDQTALIIGVGINVFPVVADGSAKPVSIAEASTRTGWTLDDATIAYIEFMDSWLASPVDSETILDRWRERSVHRTGDTVNCVIGEQTITGNWTGIDEYGRALIRQGGVTTPIAAGDLMLTE